jgi:hypothetical protein
MSGNVHDDDITMWMSITQYIASGVHKYFRILIFFRMYHDQGVSYSTTQDFVDIHLKCVFISHERVNPEGIDMQRR